MRRQIRKEAAEYGQEMHMDCFQKGQSQWVNQTIFDYYKAKIEVKQ